MYVGRCRGRSCTSGHSPLSPSNEKKKSTRRGDDERRPDGEAPRTTTGPCVEGTVHARARARAARRPPNTDSGSAREERRPGPGRGARRVGWLRIDWVASGRRRFRTIRRAPLSGGRYRCCSPPVPCLCCCVPGPSIAERTAALCVSVCVCARDAWGLLLGSMKWVRVRVRRNMGNARLCGYPRRRWSVVTSTRTHIWEEPTDAVRRWVPTVYVRSGDD